MSYIRRRSLGDLDSGVDWGAIATSAQAAKTTQGAAGTCAAGYTKDIAGNCVKAASTNSALSSVTSFLTDWFKQDQLARGRAQGAAEGAALLAAQQQSPVADYLPYILIGGGVLAAVLLLRR